VGCAIWREGLLVPVGTRRGRGRARPRVAAGGEHLDAIAARAAALALEKARFLTDTVRETEETVARSSLARAVPARAAIATVARDEKRRARIAYFFRRSEVGAFSARSSWSSTSSRTAWASTVVTARERGLLDPGPSLLDEVSGDHRDPPRGGTRRRSGSSASSRGAARRSSTRRSAGTVRSVPEAPGALQSWLWTRTDTDRGARGAAHRHPADRGRRDRRRSGPRPPRERATSRGSFSGAASGFLDRRLPRPWVGRVTYHPRRSGTTRANSELERAVVSAADRVTLVTTR
jgi:hypothetical protein